MKFAYKLYLDVKEFNRVLKISAPISDCPAPEEDCIDFLQYFDEQIVPELCFSPDVAVKSAINDIRLLFALAQHLYQQGGAYECTTTGKYDADEDTLHISIVCELSLEDLYNEKGIYIYPFKF